MKNIFRSLLLGLGIFTTTFLHAQIISSAQTSATDLSTMLEAVEQMPTVSADSVPQFGNFYSAQHAPGSASPWPPLPGNSRGVPIWDLGDGMYLLDDLDTDYSVAPMSLSSGGRMSAMSSMDGLTPGDGGGGGDGSGFYSDSFDFHPDYGTNLWIANVNRASGVFSGIASNSFADIQYEIQSKTDLTQTNWVSEGFIFGDELTNWTSFNVAAGNSTNMFFRIRSWQDDGSGLPIWWQLQYFGTNGVDPYGNPAGDGWNNLQKFQNGMNPNSFYTPPAPQTVSVNYNSANSTATISWPPSPGSVTGYTVTRNNNGTITTFNLSASTTSYTDTAPPQTPNLSTEWIEPVLNNPTYAVKAHYSGGDSASSSSINLLNKPNVAAAAIVANEQSATLVVSQPPSQATGVRLIRLGPWYAENPTSGTIATNFDIPVSSFSNGTYTLSDSQFEPPTGNSYSWYVQTLESNDQSDVSRLLGFPSTNAPPFYDGRAQLKQNLIFLLREANANAPFNYELWTNDINSYPYQIGSYSAPATYAYAGFYDANSLNIFRPFADNCLYRNFVFSSADIDDNGNMTTGVGQSDALTLTKPPTYQFDPATSSTNTLLSANQTQWLCIEPITWDGSDALSNGLSVSYAYDPVLEYDGEPVFHFNGGDRNYWGLPLASVKIYYDDDYWNLLNITLGAGNSVATWLPNAFYTETAQPQFQTVEYDFWNPTAVWNQALLEYVAPALPGDSNFSPTNKSVPIIASIGIQTQIAGYAKLAVTNGYSGVYGYLGQYFDKAYMADSNGIATANSAGFLTPYGNFFATQIGQAALVTMPDIDTGERGTDTVYVVGLALDKNHDGNMDLSLSGADATSQNSPFVFWCNNNFDRWAYDFLGSTNEQDDVLPNGDDSSNLDPRDPDCNYRVNGFRYIPDTRDLEDFARLWICGVTSNLLAALPTNSTITLSWDGQWNGYQYTYPNYPTIDLFEAADADGGIGYLTNEVSATNQLDPYQGGYVGRLAPGSSIQLNANHFGSNWRGDHFIWCGVTNGSGRLTLTIADSNGNILGQSTAYIQIKDIKDMYERWTVGDDPNKDPLAVATNSSLNLPVGELPFQYPANTDANMPYILLVHGWNDETWVKDRYAETAFKRLYWQGYNGRFGNFRWPTYTGITTYDPSEFNAWKSGTGLKNLLTTLNAEYPNNVYMMAHSMGNVVAGEALKKAGTNVLVNTYIAMQAAIPSHCYDPAATTRTIPSINDDGTPNRYAQYYTSSAPCYFNSIVGAGTFVNFFNTNDFALSAWTLDQNTKPDVLRGYRFDGTNFSQGYFTPYTLLLFPADTYEIFSFCDEARCFALGAQRDVGGKFTTAKQINLPDVWPSDPDDYRNHIWHSAEFRSDYAQRWLFWDEVLVQMRLKNNL